MNLESVSRVSPLEHVFERIKDDELPQSNNQNDGLNYKVYSTFVFKIITMVANVTCFKESNYMMTTYSIVITVSYFLTIFSDLLQN